MAKKKTYYSWRTQTHYDTKEGRDTAHKSAKASKKGRNIFTDIGDFIKSGRAKRTMEKSESAQTVKQDQAHTRRVKDPSKGTMKVGSFETNKTSKRKANPNEPNAEGVAEKTKGGDFPVYRKATPSAQSFKQRFRQARIDKEEVFEWQGRKYKSDLKKKKKA